MKTKFIFLFLTGIMSLWIPLQSYAQNVLNYSTRQNILATYSISSTGYYAIREINGGYGNAGIVSDTLYLTPFQVFKPMTVTAMATRVGTAQASSGVNMALYSANLNTGRPDALLANGTSAQATTSGGAREVSLTQAVNLFPGRIYYWGQIVSGTSSLPTLLTVAGGDQSMWLPGMIAASSPSVVAYTGTTGLVGYRGTVAATSVSTFPSNASTASEFVNNFNFNGWLKAQ